MKPETTHQPRCCCRTSDATASNVEINVTFDNDAIQTFWGAAYRFDAAGEWVSILGEDGDEIARVSTRRMLSVATVVPAS